MAVVAFRARAGTGEPHLPCPRSGRSLRFLGKHIHTEGTPFQALRDWRYADYCWRYPGFDSLVDDGQQCVELLVVIGTRERYPSLASEASKHYVISKLTRSVITNVQDK